MNISPYINRELSWLKFNMRVLEEALAIENPLFERLRFVSIFSSNLDEFYMVRVGSLYDRSLIKDDYVDNKTLLTAKQQLEKIFKETSLLIQKRDLIYDRLCSEMEQHGVIQVSPEKITDRDLPYLSDYFLQELFPLLSPQIIDHKHPFPHLINKQLYIGLFLNNQDKSVFGLIPINDFLEKLILLPSINSYKYMLVEDVICMFVDTVFKGYEIVDKVIFRITRNADLEPEEAYYEEDADYRSTMTELLKKRKKLAPVRLELSVKPGHKFEHFLRKKLGLSENQLFVTSSPMQYSFINTISKYLNNKRHTNLFYNILTPQSCKYIYDNDSVIQRVLKQDIHFSYPYQSIMPLIRLLKEATSDKFVVSIKITLYRLSSDSKIVDALIEASENGKEVIVVVELNARFDEENNINWSNKLEQAGCKVIYGISKFKVHSKILLITRKEGKRTQYITHIGTGNYNENTAKLYTDVNIITAERTIGEDAVRFFNNLTISNMKDIYKVLLVSPHGIKNTFIELIDKEIEYMRKRGIGRIICKFNSLTDKDLIDKLIEASCAGVKIDLIVRGICCLQPGIKRKTENIKVTSIVGRFLEHSRIYYFYNGGNEKLYIASADLMTRNMEKRFEIACPILDSNIKNEIMEMLEVHLRDNVKCRILHTDGNYYYKPNKGEPRINSQIYLYDQAYQNNTPTEAINTFQRKYNISDNLFSMLRKVKYRINNFF